MATSAKSPNKNEEACCLKNCSEDIERKCITVGSRKVEVKSFEPKKKRDKLLVNWNNDGSAKFHSTCWESLVKATKGDDFLGSTLTDIERSMILEAKKTAEFHDADSTILEEAKQIASILKNSKYCIAFTGAGISTAAGIADFRGKDGKWTVRDRVKNHGAPSTKAQSRAVTMEKLRPTYTHEALHKLVEMGCLKFIISQNIDGLHRLSGISKEKVSELHGNCFRERCEECGHTTELKHHYRHGKRLPESFATQKKCSRCNISHRTGRRCTQPGCRGYLMNTIINFGDYLESEVLGTAENHARQADAVLILGSSLKVSPANDLVLMGEEPHRLIICNRQTTPYDSVCRERGRDEKRLGARVFGDCDELMRRVMEHVLSSSDLQQWEREKDSRMAEYDMKRIIV